MFKGKYGLVGKIVVLLILAQMVFAPFAPVLAEELQDMEVTSTTPAVAEIMTDITPPVVETAVSGTELVVESNDLSVTIGDTSIIVPEVVVPQEIVTPTEQVVSPLSPNLFDLVTTTKAKEDNVEQLQSVVEEMEKEEKNNKQIIDLLDVPQFNEESAPVASFVDFGLADSTKDGQKFQIKDPMKDEALLPDGKMVVRLFSHPRPIFKDKNGVYRKINQPDLAFFSRDKNLRKLSGDGGYKFEYINEIGEKIVTYAGEMEIINGKKISPLSSKVSRSVIDNKNKYELNNVYPNVDVSFVDNELERNRLIVIKKPLFDKLSDIQDVVFWENYDFPAGSKILDWDGEQLKNGDTIRISPVFIAMPSGEKFEISAPIVFDSSGLERMSESLSYSIKIDDANNKLSLGIILEADYFKKTELTYPIIIDPTYGVCGGVNNRICGTYYDLYFRQGVNSNGTLSEDNSVGVAPPNFAFAGYGLHVGYSSTGWPKSGREIAIKFDSGSFVESDKKGDLSNARLNLYYDGFVNVPSNANSVNFMAKGVGGDIDFKTAKYRAVAAAGINEYENGITVTTGDVVNVYRSWDISSIINSAIFGNNYGIIVEPAGNWNGQIALNNLPPWPDRLFGFSGSEGGHDPYIEFTISFADLTDGGTTVPASVNAGQKLSVSFKVKNQGDGFASGPLTVSYYFNNSNNCSNTVNPIASGSYNIGFVPADGTNSESVDIDIPAGTAAGNYCVYYKIDSGDVVYENGNEGNNNYTKNITVTAPVAPQLSIHDFTITTIGPKYSGSGDRIAINGYVQNIGNTAVNNINYQLYLGDGADQLGAVVPANLSVNAGENKLVAFEGTIPGGMSPANYRARMYLVDSNLTAYTNNTIEIQYDYGDGGGGPAPVDELPPVVIKTTGVIQGGAIPIADKVNYPKTYPKSSDKTNPSQTADPVNARNGAFEFEQVDFKLPGKISPLVVSRVYNSKATERSERFGNGWTSSYHMFYFQDPDTHEVQIYLGGTLVSYFTTPDNGATYVAEKGNFNTLYNEGDYLIYKTSDGIKYYFAEKLIDNVGMLDKIVDTNDNITQLTYVDVRGVKLLSTISDSSNRGVRFVYPDSTDLYWDKIVQMREMLTGVDRLVASYIYDDSANLVEVKTYSYYPGEATKEIKHTFTYDGPPGHMITYTDPRGVVLYNTYDADGRVYIQHEYNARIDEPHNRHMIYELFYTDEPVPAVPGSAHCTLTDNYRDSYPNKYNEYTCFNSDELKIYNRRGDNIERWTYNGQGMIETYTDALGNVKSYQYDVQRRPTQETLPDTNGWHTVTNYTYYDNPSRLKTKIETATKAGEDNITRTTTYTVSQDGRGNVTFIVYPLGVSENFSYNADGTIATHTNRKNGITTYGYDSNGYKKSESITFAQADGSMQTVAKGYVYNEYGNLTDLTNGGNTTNYAYDTRGNLREEINPYGDSKSYEYDLMDHKIKETDALGRVTRFNYDTDLNASLLSIVKESVDGNITNSRQYDYVGNLTKEIDPLGREVSYTYDSANRIQTKTDAQKITTYEYYANGLLKKETVAAIASPDTVVKRLDYFYDSRGNKTEIRKYYNENNYITNKQEYDGFGRVTKEIDGNNQNTVLTYNLLDRMTAKVTPDGGMTSYNYDSNGNKTVEIYPRVYSGEDGLTNHDGHSMSYLYDKLNHLIKQTNASDQVTQYFYDTAGNLIRTVDRQNSDGTANDHTTAIEYYKTNLKQKETFADDSFVSYTYDKVGNLKTKTDQTGQIWNYNYDDFNRLTDEIDPAGKVTHYGYDKAGNKTSVTYPDNTDVTYQYDVMNRLEYIYDDVGANTAFGYDVLGYKVVERNKRAYGVTYVHDWLGRLISERASNGLSTWYTYDGNGNRLTQSTGGKVTTFVYDELGRLTHVTYPGNKTEGYDYDVNSNKISFIDGNNQTTTFDYDKLDRPTFKHLPDFTVEYVYDNWDNLTSLKDQSGTTDYVYNEMNMPTTETKTITGLAGSKIIGRTYKPDGKLDSITDAANRQIVYNYNNRGLLEDVRLGVNVLASYAYTDFGKPLTLVYANGMNTAYGYDTLNRVVSIETKNVSSTVVFKQAYQYDEESNRTVMTETRLSEDGTPITATTNYTYDGLDQLTDVDYTDVNGVSNDLTYRYNTHGNRTLATSPFESSAYTYTLNTNELASVSYNSGRLIVANQYDGNGSLTKEIYTRLGKNTKEINYTWNSENRLGRIAYKDLSLPAFMPASQDQTLDFVYDAYGNRVKKSLNGADATYYINDGLTVLNELDSAGNVNKTMVKGLDPLVEIDKDNVITYIHTDILGSAVMLTNAQGNVVRQYEYDPFGQIATNMGDAGKDTNYTFTNQEWDPESELYYYNARYYNPRLGRFISRDTVLGNDGDILSRNLYIYVKNNPLKYTDPTGNVTKAMADQLKTIAQSWANSILNTVNNAKDTITQTANNLQNYFSAIDIAKMINGSGKVIGGSAVAAGGALACGSEVAVCVPATIGSGLVTAPAGGVGAVATGGVCFPLAAAGCVGGLTVGGAMIGSGMSDIMQSVQTGQGGGGGSSSVPKPSPNFKMPTNPPQLPPKIVPEGIEVRVMKPTQQYPNGYWRMEKPMPQGGAQGINPTTMKPGTQAETHIPLPQGYWQ